MPTKTDVKLSTLSYVILYVKDANKSLPFYRDTLGLKVRVDSPGWVEFETGATTVALHSDEKLPAVRPHGQAIAVFNVEDIDAAYESLKAKGIKFAKEPQVVCETDGKAGRSADFQDPDGNPLSIFGYSAKK